MSPASTKSDINDEPVADLAQDFVPTIDQEAPVASYPDWSKADTKMMVYSVGNTVYPGKFAESRDAARRDCEQQHGRILEANYVPGRAFFRVRKVK